MTVSCLTPGIDGLTVEQFSAYLRQYWPAIRQQLQDGTYRPKPVRRVEIPKADGRMRKLGIPTVLDRFIQQAIAQVLQSDWDQHFHEHSYGFRPNRNAHQAIRYAQSTIRAGHRWVVDCDLDAFFDRVNHDRLMTRLKLRLKVNTRKSAVDRPWNRVFLGITFSRTGQRIKVSDKAIQKLKAKVRKLSRRTLGHSLSQIIAELRKSLLGWKAYFRYQRSTEPSA